MITYKQANELAVEKTYKQCPLKAGIVYMCIMSSADL